MFIAHEASRTGAPLLLLQFLRWLKAHESCAIDVLLLRGGELEGDFAEVATVLHPRIEMPPRLRGMDRVRERLGLIRDDARGDEARYDLVVGNTVLALPHLERYQHAGMPTLLWVHELDYAVGELTDARFPYLCRHVDRFLVVSEAVAMMLRARGIAAPIDVVHGFAKPVGSIDDAVHVRRQLGIAADAFVVGACGTIEWRKGVDLFLQIARDLAWRCDDIHFLWVGGGSESELRRIRHDLARMEIGGRVTFSGPQVQADAYLSAMDVFALTSREDPFPLVCLEAARLEKPIVCFANAGGAVELVEDDAGVIVPYADTHAFAAALLRYRGDRTAAWLAGKTARAKVEARYTMERACTRIRQVFDDAAHDGARTRRATPRPAVESCAMPP
ncbi:Glycosyl transferase [Lysobacter dokdonensis DS-58]|uniref:Glycosyl transferase n=1 Tax=Lysobacter dokdonensis DS-58 TaxID=1300345 RepID=A0A0A2WKJ0_9GAMM|nr:Glycosyl transferase [Lysobacter dokdonensis DS-58]